MPSDLSKSETSRCNRPAITPPIKPTGDEAFPNRPGESQGLLRLHGTPRGFQEGSERPVGISQIASAFDKVGLGFHQAALDLQGTAQQSLGLLRPADGLQ